MILYPAIDIRGGRAVRLVRGDFAAETTFDADPAEAARRWTAKGARYLHVVDLDGAREGRPVNIEAVGRVIQAAGVPVQVGGGLRDAGSVGDVLAGGADRAVLGTGALDRDLLDAVLAEHGDRIVVSVDSRGGQVATEGWRETTEADAAEAVAELSSRGVERFVFTPIDVDGTMSGPDLGELRRVADATDAELIYSGGVGELSHLEELRRAGPPNVGGVIVGRALYQNRFTVGEGQAALD